MVEPTDGGGDRQLWRLLAAMASLMLAGTLALVFDPGVYTPSSYKLLTATSISGAFSTVTGNNPSGLPQALLYDLSDVTLQLSANTPTPIVIVPTNDTIYSAVTSTAILTAQQANGIILDRLGQRRAGIAGGDQQALAAPMHARATGLGDQLQRGAEVGHGAGALRDPCKHLLGVGQPALDPRA